MRLIRVYPQAWLTKYTVFTFPFSDSGSLISILPSGVFHRFQIIFDRIRLTFSVVIGTIFGLESGEFEQKFSKNSNARGVARGGMFKLRFDCYINIPKPRRSCSWTYKINKLLVSLNERLNNIILLERTIEYNTTQPQNSTAKESNATSESEAHGKKDQSPHGLLTCSHVRQISHVSVTVPVY